MAQSVKHLTLGFGSGHIFKVRGIEPHFGSELTAWGLLRVLSLFLSLSLSQNKYINFKQISQDLELISNFLCIVLNKDQRCPFTSSSLYHPVPILSPSPTSLPLPSFTFISSLSSSSSSFPSPPYLTAGLSSPYFSSLLFLLFFVIRVSSCYRSTFRKHFTFPMGFFTLVPL